MRKILCSMPQKKWEAKTTSIQELRDRTLTMQALNGKLLTYEIYMKNEEGRRSKDLRKNRLTLNVGEKECNDIDDDELIMFIRRFQRYKLNKAMGTRKDGPSK